MHGPHIVEKEWSFYSLLLCEGGDDQLREEGRCRLWFAGLFQYPQSIVLLSLIFQSSSWWKFDKKYDSWLRMRRENLYTKYLATFALTRMSLLTYKITKRIVSCVRENFFKKETVGFTLDVNFRRMVCGFECDTCHFWLACHKRTHTLVFVTIKWALIQCYKHSVLRKNSMIN